MSFAALGASLAAALGTGATAAIPAGMATAGGMASGIGTAGAVGASAIPELMGTLGSSALTGAAKTGGGLLAAKFLGGPGTGAAGVPPRLAGNSLMVPPPSFQGITSTQPVGPALPFGGITSRGSSGASPDLLQMLLRLRG